VPPPSRIVQSARRLAAPIRPLLYRRRPFSTWGLERGTPVDRIYIEGFLERHRADVQGVVLEVKDRAYADRFGHDVERIDVLDVDPGNALATVVGDLSAPDSLPPATYDCFVFTQTLQYVADPAAAVRNAAATLRPGGVLLASVPCIAHVEARARDTDRWRFTEASCRDLFGAVFAPGDVAIETRGNVAAATAFLMGMAGEELGAARLAEQDPDFPVVVLVRAVKPGS
jgi:SAM-dependent methyltransferase